MLRVNQLLKIDLEQLTLRVPGLTFRAHYFPGNRYALNNF
jgi:hypothetical protein